MFEGNFGFIEICIAVFIGAIGQAIFLKIFLQKKNESKLGNIQDYNCRLMIDHDQRLFYNWLQNDTQQNVSWATGDMWGKTKSDITLHKMQIAPWDSYPPRFPSKDETESDFHFRCGGILNVDRFDMILMPKQGGKELISHTFGHIEFVYQDSVRFNRKVVWLYCVYIQPKYRGKKLGKVLINKSLDYCYNDKRYKEIHLIVDQDNERAHSLYKKCGFEEYMRVNDKGHGIGYIVMKHKQ